MTRDRQRPPATAVVAIPILGTVYQISATMTARACEGAVAPALWLRAATASPWFWVLIASEAASLVAWTAILARVPLSRAFPISAVGYILVVAVAAIVFREPLLPASVIGSVAILGGAALLATDIA